MSVNRGSLDQVDESIFFAQLSDSTNQEPTVLTPVKVTMNTNDKLVGVTHSTSSNTADIIIQKKGTYMIIAAPQFGRTLGSQARFVNFWFRVNNVDVANTNVRGTLGFQTDTDVIITQIALSLNVNDVVNVMMSIEALSEGIGIKATTVAGEPLIPSIIFTMYKI